MKKLSQQSGLTLVEIMIALVLSAVIIGGIVQVFISNRQSYAITESLVRIQENGRFALNYMSAALRSTGNYGCVPDTISDANNIQVQLAGERLSDITPIQLNAPGPDDSLNTQDGAFAPADEFDDPDTLSILVSTGNVAEITGLLNGAPPYQLSITPDGDFEEDDYVIVSSCQVADFIRLGNSTGVNQIEDDTSGLRVDFFNLGNVTATVQEVQAITFSINQATDALQIQLIDTNTGEMQAPQELLTGIENMQIEYGVDTGSDLIPDYFANITDVQAQNNTDDIVAVRIRLVAISGLTDEGFTDNVTTSPQTLVFGDKTISTEYLNDNRLRRTFETVVSLRNQLN